MRFYDGGEQYYRQYLLDRVIRGGPAFFLYPEKRPLDDKELTPRFRLGQDRNKGLAAVGFRCARSAAPRFLD